MRCIFRRKIELDTGPNHPSGSCSAALRCHLAWRKQEKQPHPHREVLPPSQASGCDIQALMLVQGTGGCVPQGYVMNAACAPPTHIPGSPWCWGPAGTHSCGQCARPGSGGGLRQSGGHLLLPLHAVILFGLRWSCCLYFAGEVLSGVPIHKKAGMSLA